MDLEELKRLLNGNFQEGFRPGPLGAPIGMPGPIGQRGGQLEMADAPLQYPEPEQQAQLPDWLQKVFPSFGSGDLSTIHPRAGIVPMSAHIIAPALEAWEGATRTGSAISGAGIVGTAKAEQEQALRKASWFNPGLLESISSEEDPTPPSSDVTMRAYRSWVDAYDKTEGGFFEKVNAGATAAHDSIGPVPKGFFLALEVFSEEVFITGTYGLGKAALGVANKLDDMIRVMDDVTIPASKIPEAAKPYILPVAKAAGVGLKISERVGTAPLRAEDWLGKQFLKLPVRYARLYDPSLDPEEQIQLAGTEGLDPFPTPDIREVDLPAARPVPATAWKSLFPMGEKGFSPTTKLDGLAARLSSPRYASGSDYMVEILVDDLHGVGLNFDLDRVTQGMVDRAKRQIAARTREGLDARDLPDEFIVYRIGELYDGPISTTLDLNIVQSMFQRTPRGKSPDTIRAFRVTKSDVLADVDAVLGRNNPYVEEELLIDGSVLRQKQITVVAGQPEIRPPRPRMSPEQEAAFWELRASGRPIEMTLGEPVSAGAPAAADEGISVTRTDAGYVVKGHHGTREPGLPTQYDFGGLHIGTRKAALDRLEQTPSLRPEGRPGAEEVLPVEITLRKPYGTPEQPIDETELFTILGLPDNARVGMKRLTDEGYDGIIYRNVEEDPGSISVLAFDPSAARAPDAPGVHPFTEMAKAQHIGRAEALGTGAFPRIGLGLHQGTAEAVGDIINRIGEGAVDVTGRERASALSATREKVDRAYSYLLDPDDFAKQVDEDLRSNIRDTGTSYEDAKETMRQWGLEYADEYRKLPTYNQAHRDAQEVAIAYGEGRYDDAIEVLRRMKLKLEGTTDPRYAKHQPEMIKVSDEDAFRYMYEGADEAITAAAPSPTAPPTSRPYLAARGLSRTQIGEITDQIDRAEKAIDSLTDTYYEGVTNNLPEAELRRIEDAIEQITQYRDALFGTRQAALPGAPTLDFDPMTGLPRRIPPGQRGAGSPTSRFEYDPSIVGVTKSGKRLLIDRLRLELSKGHITEEQHDAAVWVIDKGLNEKFIDDLGISFRKDLVPQGTPPPGTVLGEYQPQKPFLGKDRYDPDRPAIIRILTGLSDKGFVDVERTIIHEISHHLEEFVSSEDARHLVSQYKRALRDKAPRIQRRAQEIDANIAKRRQDASIELKKAKDEGRDTPTLQKEILLKAQATDAEMRERNLAYRYSNFAEWFAEQMTDRFMRDLTLKDAPVAYRNAFQKVMDSMMEIAKGIRDFMTRMLGRGDEAERVYGRLRRGDYKLEERRRYIWDIDYDPLRSQGQPRRPDALGLAQEPRVPGREGLPWTYVRGEEEADFWIQTVGTNAGKVMRAPTANSIGIKVDPEVLDANYAFYMFQNAENQGAFRGLQKGTATPFISQDDIDTAIIQTYGQQQRPRALAQEPRDPRDEELIRDMGFPEDIDPTTGQMALEGMPTPEDAGRLPKMPSKRGDLAHGQTVPSEEATEYLDANSPDTPSRTGVVGGEPPDGFEQRPTGVLDPGGDDSLEELRLYSTPDELAMKDFITGEPNQEVYDDAGVYMGLAKDITTKGVRKGDIVTILRRAEGSLNMAANEAMTAAKEGEKILHRLGLTSTRGDREIVKESAKEDITALFRALHGALTRDALVERNPGLGEAYDRLRVLTDWEEKARLDWDPGLIGSGMADSPDVATGVRHYFYRGWRESDALAQARKKLSGGGGAVGWPASFEKPRNDASFDQMLAAGFEPLSWNPFEQWRISRMQGMRRRQQDALVQLYKSLEIAVPTTESANIPLSGYRIPDIGPAFEGKPIAFIDEVIDPNTGEPMNVTKVKWDGRYAVPDEVAKRLETIYGKVKLPSPVTIPGVGLSIDMMKVIDVITFVPKRAKLMLSLFQQSDFIMRNIVGNWGMFVDEMMPRMVDGKPVISRPTGKTLQRLALPRDVYDIIHANLSPDHRAQLKKSLNSTEPLIPGRPGVHLKGIMEAGLSIRDVTILPEIGGLAQQVAEEHGLARTKSVIRLVKRLEDASRRGLFEGVYPAAQVSDIRNNIAKQVVAQYGDRFTDEAINGIIARTANMRYSTIPPSQSVFQNRMLRGVLARIFFSIGESEAFLRQAFESTPFIGRKYGRYWRNNWLGAWVGLITMANAIHFAATQESLPSDRYSPVAKDNWGPLPFSYNRKFASPTIGGPNVNWGGGRIPRPFGQGTYDYELNPFMGRGGTEVLLDIVGQFDTSLRILDPKSFLFARESVPIRALHNQIQGTDFMGNPIDTEGPFLGIYSRTSNLLKDAFAPIGPGEFMVSQLERVPGSEKVLPPHIAEGRIGIGGQAIQATGIFNVRGETTPDMKDRLARDSGFTIQGRNDPRFGEPVTSWADLSPSQRDEIESRPSVAEEFTKRREIGAIRGDEFSKSQIQVNQLEDRYIKDVNRAAESFLESKVGVFSPEAFRQSYAQYRDDLYKRLYGYFEEGEWRGGIYEDMPAREEPQKNTLEHTLWRHRQIFERSRNEQGEIDFTGEQGERFEREEALFWGSLTRQEAQEVIENIRLIEGKLSESAQNQIDAGRYASSFKISIPREKKSYGYWDLQTHPQVLRFIMSTATASEREVLRYLEAGHIERTAQSKSTVGERIDDAYKKASGYTGRLGSLQRQFVQSAPEEWKRAMFDAGYNYKGKKDLEKKYYEQMKTGKDLRSIDYETRYLDNLTEDEGRRYEMPGLVGTGVQDRLRTRLPSL
jgi:hypothetical protein